jgi:amino acid permease
MNLKETVSIALAVSFFMIGIHQSSVNGIVSSYWIFMIALAFVLLFRFFRATKNINIKPKEEVTNSPMETTAKDKKKKNKKR